MIPIHESERLPWDDPDDKVRYFFRAITGEHEVKFFDILARDSKEKSLDERRKILNDMIDFLLIGWEPAGGEIYLPSFPADGKPSAFFNARSKNKLIEAAMEVNRLTEQDSKNL